MRVVDQEGVVEAQRLGEVEKEGREGGREGGRGIAHTPCPFFPCA